MPWEKWYPTNWASEPGLRLCDPATRGIWFEMINTMMLKQQGFVSGTVNELSSLCSCQPQVMRAAIEQIRKNGVGNCRTNGQQNANIIIECRRLVRHYAIKGLRRKAGEASAAKRQQDLFLVQSTQGQQTSASASVSASASWSSGGDDGGAEELLEFLNEQTGRTFRESDSSLTPIRARLRERGVTVEDCKTMIHRQVVLWKGTKMEEYLRPQTLFGKEKFESYYAARNLPVNHDGDGKVVALKREASHVF